MNLPVDDGDPSAAVIAAMLWMSSRVCRIPQSARDVELFVDVLSPAAGAQLAAGHRDDRRTSSSRS